MREYPEYKASGVDWLGDIPQEWKLNRYKNAIRIFQGMAFKSNDYVEHSQVISVRMGNIKKGGFIDLEHNAKYLPNNYKDSFKEYILKERDLIIAMTDMSPSLDFLAVPAILKGLDNNFSYLLNQRVGKLIINRSFDTNFLKYLLLSHELRSQLKSLGLGAVQSNMSSEELYGTFFAAPQFIEQQTIVNFLDYKTGLIDKFIANRQKQIELLKEQKAAIINKAVTKGINPHAKMKASGIEWIGDMPEDWQVWKLKFITKKIGSGVTPLGGSQVYKTEGIAFFRSQNIYNDKLELSNISFIDEETHRDMKNSQIEFGDVLLNITGASIGRCFFFSGEYQEANVNQHVCIIRSNKKILFQFLHSVMISEIGQNQIFSKQSGTNREGLNFEQLKNFNIPLPEKEEQQLILNYIKIETTKIDNLSSKYQKQIELMQEYKTALISQAVTGKIDVRNWRLKK